jgi:hypothetical protein
MESESGDERCDHLGQRGGGRRDGHPIEPPGRQHPRAEGQTLGVGQELMNPRQEVATGRRRRQSSTAAVE